MLSQCWDSKITGDPICLEENCRGNLRYDIKTKILALWSGRGDFIMQMLMCPQDLGFEISSKYFQCRAAREKGMGSGSGDGSRALDAPRWQKRSVSTLCVPLVSLLVCRQHMVVVGELPGLGQPLRSGTQCGDCGADMEQPFGFFLSFTFY